MIEYAIRDVDDVELILNDSAVKQPVEGSVRLGADIITYQNRIVENSALPGSVKLGKTRVQSRQLTIMFSRAETTDVLFRAAENAVAEFFSKAVSLVDKTNNLLVPIAVLDYRINYDEGSRLRSSSNEIVLELLDPFWRNLTATNVPGTIVEGTTDIAITNDGALTSPPVLTFTTSVVVNQLQIYVNENKEGIQVNDALFGTAGNLTLVIDCENGTIVISGSDRINSILAGTGFFDLIVGAQTLKVVSSAACTLSLDYFKRFFV